MTRTTTARTIKRDRCKEAGKKGRTNKNNIGDEEKETQEKEKKQEEGEKNKNKKTYNPKTKKDNRKKKED